MACDPAIEFRGRSTMVAALVAAMVTVVSGEAAVASETGESGYARWDRGPSDDPSYFPIAVWVQDPELAPRYRGAGINLYVGLWKGPTEEQLEELKAAGMQVICSQNEVGLEHLSDETIVGWMHGDEPDNAQSLGEGEGYGPPILPERIAAGFEKIQTRDPSRPVLLNLGQGVAWDGWVGRGVRTNHPGDYREYVKGGDIVSFDIYPAASSRDETAGKLWLVPKGVERLRRWSEDSQTVWNCIECTSIHSEHKATPRQVRTEVWMSLIRGSMGLIYFVHQWHPEFNSHALLDDAEMLAAVTDINSQVHSLAPVLNSPTVEDGVEIGSRNPDVPVAAILKRHDGASYLFAVGMREGQTEASFAVSGLPPSASAEVIGEDRSIEVIDGFFTDAFGDYDVHLYRIP